MPQDTPSRKLDQYIVRFPDGMRDRLKFEAQKSGRSLNAEIVARLEQSFAADEHGLESPAVQEMLLGRVRNIMDEVVDDMREERRIYNAIPLVLKWFETDPDGRAEYDKLTQEEQDEFIRDKAHELWLDRLNAKRAARTGKVK